jgi:hypothetical protein
MINIIFIVAYYIIMNTKRDISLGTVAIAVIS